MLEEYKGHRKPGHILHVLHILHILIYLSTSAWLAQCQSTIVYERREQAQVLYVIPVSSILGCLHLETPESLDMVYTWYILGIYFEPS